MRIKPCYTSKKITYNFFIDNQKIKPHQDIADFDALELALEEKGFDLDDEKTWWMIILLVIINIFAFIFLHDAAIPDTKKQKKKYMVVEVVDPYQEVLTIYFDKDSEIVSIDGVHSFKIIENTYLEMIKK
jgi:hypothetical protein